jgi:hypothetical protein
MLAQGFSPGLGIDESPALKERQTGASHAKMARPDFVALSGHGPFGPITPGLKPG